ncbi:hypothetical protein MRX96_025185 [Rhipicephalus microplus]
MTVWLTLLYGAASLALLPCSVRGNIADDSVLFSINWPGASPDKKLAPVELETLWMVSAEKERYKCLLPANPVSREDAEAAAPYAGPTPLALLKPLFSRLFCSYRLEQYWTYELCHGKSVRQYHEESIDNKVVLQEYFLGKYDSKKLEADDSTYLSTRSRRPPRIRLEGGPGAPVLCSQHDGRHGLRAGRASATHDSCALRVQPGGPQRSAQHRRALDVRVPGCGADTVHLWPIRTTVQIHRQRIRFSVWPRTVPPESPGACGQNRCSSS